MTDAAVILSGMKHTLLLHLTLCVVALMLGITTPLSAQPRLTNDIEKLGDWMEAYGFSGIIAAADEDGRVIRAIGLANPLRGKKYSRITPFDIASVSKHMTALVILSLVQKEQIDLGAPIKRYLPEVTGPAGDVTVQSLLNHTSGLDKDIKPGDPVIEGLTYPESLIAALNAAQLKSPIGDAFRYSNIGYCTLGHLAERVTGRSLGRQMRRTLFTQANIYGDLYQPDSRSAKKLPIAVEDGAALDPYAWTGLPLHKCGAAGVVMAMPSLLSWLEILTSPDCFLSDLVTVQRLSIGEASAQKAPYGSGIRISDLGFGPALWHDGDTSAHEVFAARGLYAPVSLVFHTNSRDGWREAFKETAFALAQKRLLNLPPRPESCKDCVTNFKEEGLTLAFDGAKGVAEVSATAVLKLLKPGIPDSTITDKFIARGAAVADAIVQNRPDLLTPYISANEDAVVRLEKLRTDLGFAPSSATPALVSPWRNKVFQTHVAFKDDSGNKAGLRLVWHPRTGKLLFTGRDESAALSTTLYRVEENAAVVQDLRSKQWRKLQLSPFAALTDWQPLVPIKDDKE